MKTKLAIIGSGDLGQQIAHFAMICGFNVVGYYDDFEKKNTSKKGIKILGGVNDILKDYDLNVFDQLSLGIGYKHMKERKGVFDRLSSSIDFANIIHPTVHIDPTVILGSGVVIYPGTVIDAHAKIGDNVLMNVSCTVSHHTCISNHCFLSPRVALAGFISVGECSILGINSTVIDNIRLVENTQLGGGSVVIKSNDKSGLYVGNPVRFVRTLQ